MPGDPLPHYPPRFGGARRVLLAASLVATLTLLPLGVPDAVSAQAPADLVSAWGVPGSPETVSAASSTEAWFTLPAERAIGQLVLDPSGAATVTVHDVGCSASDLVTLNGVVWWICASGERIGRREFASGATESYPLLFSTWIPVAAGGGGPADTSTPPSVVGPQVSPHLAMHPAAPGQVWFTLPASLRIGRLTVAGDPASYTLSFFTMPDGAMQPNDIALESTTKAWITVPDQSRLYQLNTALQRFVPQGTGPGSRPWAVTMDGMSPWFTDLAGDRIGNWNPSTLTIISWRKLTPGSQPFDLAVQGDFVWFSEASGQRLGRLSTASYRGIEGIALPGGTPNPAGVSVDEVGGVWSAAPGTRQLLRWRPPYFHWIHLPLVSR